MDWLGFRVLRGFPWQSSSFWPRFTRKRETKGKPPATGNAWCCRLLIFLRVRLFAGQTCAKSSAWQTYVTSWAVLDACCASFTIWFHNISHPWFLYRPRMTKDGTAFISLLDLARAFLLFSLFMSKDVKGQGSIMQQLFHLVTCHLLREAVCQHGFSFHPYGVAGCILWYMISIKGISILLSTSTPQDLTQIAHVYC